MRSGFFIPDLVEGVAPGLEAANVIPFPSQPGPFLSERFARPKTALAIREAYADGGRIPHVFLENAVRSEEAEAIHAALLAATFQRHHHTAYEISVARRAQLADSALTRFMDWLGTQEAADFHRALTGAPRRNALRPAQVQTSRLMRGDQFPLHEDTDEEGLAAVYNFTRPWDDAFGGALSFPYPDRDGDELRAPVLFNSLMLFRPANARHRVERITDAAGDLPRFTVTAFYLAV